MLNRLLVFSIAFTGILISSHAEAALLCTSAVSTFRFISVGGTVGIVEKGVYGEPTVLLRPADPPVRKTPTLWSMVYESADKATVVELEIDISTPENKRTAAIRVLESNVVPDIKLTDCKQF